MTIDKRETLRIIREWRKECRSQDEARAFADVIELIQSGELDA